MIVCIDPGDTTGIYADGFYAQVKEFIVIDVLDGQHESEGVEVVVLERFNLYDKRTKANAQHTLDVIGAVTYWCWKHEVQLVLQWNRDKNQVTDADLDARGMLAKPKSKWRHANDAARHYLYYMNRKR